MKHYYVDHEGNLKGPVSGREIFALARSGVITPETTVILEGGRETQANKIKGIVFKESDLEPIAEIVATPEKTDGTKKFPWKLFVANRLQQKILTSGNSYFESMCSKPHLHLIKSTKVQIIDKTVICEIFNNYRKKQDLDYCTLDLNDMLKEIRCRTQVKATKLKITMIHL